ncbi:MAG: hypothetical protein ACTSPV_05170 [Candidatus Hodarchaeales archaeon]
MKELKCKKCGRISYSASEKSRCPYCSGENSEIEREVGIRKVVVKKEEKKVNKCLVDLLTDAWIKYFGMSIAHGGKLPSFYVMSWKDFGLAYRAKQLNLSPEKSIKNTMLDMKRRNKNGKV